MKTNIAKIIEGLMAVSQIGEGKYMAKCPCHKDDKASLCITDVKDKILLHCFAGCSTEDIVNKLGLSMKDLYQIENTSNVNVLENEYCYTDEIGNPLYKTMRFNPKRFVQAKFYNNEWIFNMKNVRYVLYNLPNVIKSDIIYFVEGEKDADNLNSIGLTTTTTIGRSC